MNHFSIETERLILREILFTDDTGMFELDSDPEVHLFLGNNPVQTIEQSREAILYIQEQYRKNGIGRWAVIHKETGNFMGWSGLKFITEKTNNHTNYYDLGYRFMKKYWGKGYAYEAAKASIDYGLKTMKLREIYADADSQNTASKMILKKVGMHYVETFNYKGITCDWYKISNQNF